MPHISRRPYIDAPRGDAVHAYGQCHTAPDGKSLVEAVVHHAFDGEYYYTRRVYRRRSDDAGKTWAYAGPVLPGGADAPDPKKADCCAPRHALDPATGWLLSVHSDWLISRGEGQFSSVTTAASYRVHFQLSKDQGRTWSPAKQVIHKGPQHNAQHWLPGVTYGQNSAYVESAPTFLPDGSVLLRLVIAPLDEHGKLYLPLGAGYWYEVGYLRGTWNADRTDLQWEMGDRVRVGTDVSSVGACEPDLIVLKSGRLVSTFRCQGDASRGLASSRQIVHSDDLGRTWSAPRPVCYDDGEVAHVPAAFTSFMRSPRTGKVWWFANLLDRAVPAQYPRCPLAMAEFDERNLCLLRATQTVVQDLPPGASPCTSDTPRNDEECGRQYTNWGEYVDPHTGEMVLVMPEMPRTTWAEFTSDCVEWRVRD
ncbi:MAG: sialidase family protein [Planctomycetota bacterium]|nr:sialidase family protein [Planctomycetota bacterium]